MNSNKQSIPSAKEYLKKKNRDRDKVSATDYLKRKKAKKGTSAKAYLKEKRKGVSAKDYLLKDKNKAELSSASYANMPEAESGDPVAKQRAQAAKERKGHRQKINKKSALLAPGKLKESNRYFNDVGRVAQGMSDAQKQEIRATIAKQNIPDDKFAVMKAISANPQLKDYVAKNLAGNDYKDIDPSDLAGNIASHNEIEGAHEDVYMRGALIKSLEKQIKDNAKKAEELRSQSTNIDGNGKPKEQGGRFSVPHYVNDEDKYKKSKKLSEENDVLKERLAGLRQQQQYLTGTDSDRAEIDEGGLQKTIEEAGKGVGRGLVNLPKSIATLGANLDPDPMRRLAAKKVQKALQDVNDSETLAMDKDLQGKTLGSVSSSNLIPYLAGKVGESAPTMLPGLGVGKALEGAGAVAQIAGAGLSAFPIETAGQLEDAEQQAEKEGRQVTTGEKWLAVGSGLLASAVEGVGDVALLKNISKGLDATGIDDAAKEAAKKEIADGLARVALQSGKKAGEGVATESATEGVQQVIENAGAKYGWDNDRGYFNGVLEAMTVGGILGGGVSGGVAAVQESSNQRARKQARKEFYDNNQQRLGTPFKSNTDELLGAENTVEEKQKRQALNQGVQFNYDPEASHEQQKGQLAKERGRLESIKAIREARGESTEDVDSALNKIGDIENDITQPAEANETKQDVEQRKRDARKQELRDKHGTLRSAEGDQVQYGDYEGQLGREKEGNYVVDTSDQIVEVQDSRKDPSQKLDDLNIQRKSNTIRNAQWTGDNTIEITNTDLDTGGQETRSYTFGQFNQNGNGDIASMTLQNENGEDVTVRDPKLVERVLMDDYFRKRESDNSSADIDQEVNQAIDEVESDSETQSDFSINDQDQRVQKVLDKFDSGESLTPQENKDAKQWVDETLSEIEQASPKNADDLVNQLGEFENEVNKKTDSQQGIEFSESSGVGQPPPVGEDQDAAVQNEPGREDQDVQEPQEDVEPDEDVKDEETGRPEPYVTNDKKYEVFRDEYGQIQTRNRKTGKVVGKTSKNRKAVLTEYLASDKSSLPTLDDAIAKDPEITRGEEHTPYPAMVARHSSNPVEIIEALRQHRSRLEQATYNPIRKEFPWDFYTLTSRTVRSNGDWDALPQNIKAKSRNAVKESKKSSGEQSGHAFAADEIAEIVNEQHNTDLSPSDIYDDWLEYHQSRQGKQGQIFDDQTSEDLAERFHEVTGQKYEPEFADDILKAHAKEQGEVSGDQQYRQLEDAVDDYVDDNGNINYDKLKDDPDNPLARWFAEGQLTQDEINYEQEIQQQQKNEQGTKNTPANTSAEEDSGASQKGQWRGFGSRQDYEGAQQVIRDALRDQGVQLNSGFDPSQFKPKVIQAFLKLGAYHLQDGAIKFGDWAAQMVQDAGEHIKPALKHVYNQLRERGDVDPNKFSSEEEINSWLDDHAAREGTAEKESANPTQKGRHNDSKASQEGTPQKKASDGSLAAFQKDIAPHTQGLASSNIEVATRAAEQATQQALDNGVASYLEFQKWVQQSINGDPNYQALQEVWDNMLLNDVNQNKLDINNKKGTLWTKTKNIADGVRFSVTKAMAVYNQRVRDVETSLEDIFGKDYFSGENSKYIMSWAMDRVSGQVGAMIDDFINPNKSYSVLSKIIRDMGAHPDINTSDFNEIDDLYKDLAEANRKRETGTARKIEEKIKEITEKDDLQQWMIAKHAIESNKYSQEKNSERLTSIATRIGNLEKKLSQLDALDAKTELQKSKERKAKKDLAQAKTERLNILQPLGVSTKEASDIIYGMRERGIASDLDAIAARVRKLDDRILTMAVENGVVSKQDAKNMREVYKYHIPANRKLTDDTGNLVEDFGTTGGQDGDVKVYSREGSQRVIGYALGNVVSNFQDMVQYSFNNKAKADIGASIERETGKGNFSLGKVVNASEIGNTSEDNITEFTRPELVKEYDEDGIPEAVEQIVDKAIVWADPELAKAVNGTDLSSVSEVPGKLRYALRATVNLQRAVLTGLNPSFILTNPLRDIQDATLNVGNRTNNKNAWRVLKNDVFPELQNDKGEQRAWNKRIFAGQRAILAYERGNQQGNELVQAYDELKHAGGTSSYYRFRGTDHIVDEINNRIAKVRELQKGGHAANAKAIASNTLKVFELYNEVMENATRLAVYKTLRDDGKTVAEAARLGKEATINFDMQGTWSPWFKMGYVFFQPSINSITSFAKGITKPKNIAKSTGLLIAYGVAMAAYNDEMKEEGNYYKDKQAHPWKYNSNHVLTIPGIDNDITAPMGYTMSMFTGFGGHLYDYLKGYSDFSTFAKRSASLPLNVYNPLGGSQAVESGEDFVAAVTPTAFKPVAEVALNTSFFGPIYNKRMDGDDNIPDYLLRSSNDRWVSTMLSNWLAKHSIADMSPKTFDHYIDFVEGGLGKDIEKGASTVTQFVSAASKGFKNNDGSTYYGPDPNEVPILRRFVDDADPARIAYSSIWNRTEDIGNALDINSDAFETQLESLQKDYKRAKESGIYQEYQIEALDGAIARYIKDNYQQSTVKQTIRELRKEGLTGSRHKKERQRYYKRQNLKTKQVGMRFVKWEDGRIKPEFTKSRKKLTKNMIGAIEIKVADITNTDNLR